MFFSHQPFTGQLILEREPWGPEKWAPVLDMAWSQQKPWRRKTVIERIQSLSGLVGVLEARKQELAILAGEEMGKPIRQAEAEIDKCIWMCRYYLQHAEDIMTPRSIQDKDLQGLVQYQPLGVVLGIMPWNFPFWQTLRFAIPALLAGNAVLIKPAPQMLRSADLLEEIMSAVLPFHGLFRNLFVEPESLEGILDTERIAGVSLTGSERAGRSIASLAGLHVLPTVLELGGSDAFIVFPDADLEKAARTAVLSRMTNNGQTCIAAKRWLVHKDIADDFLALSHRELDALQTGPPSSYDSFFTCLAREDLADTVERQVRDALDKGAVLTTGPRSSVERPTHYAPRVLTNVQTNMNVWKEEVFAPVGVLATFSEWDEALDMANDTSYGLGASIWTKDNSKALSWAALLDVGTVAINGLVRSDPRLPFGGVKRSGYGRELGPEGMHSFCNIQSVILDA